MRRREPYVDDRYLWPVGAEQRRRYFRWAVARDGADALVPAALSAVVVRLRARADAARNARRRVLRVAHCPIPLDRRGAVRAPRDRLPRRRARPQPLAATRQVAARDTSLHRALLPRARRDRRGHRGLVRHSHQRTLSPVALRLRGGSHALGPSCRGVCLTVGDRPLSAFQPQLSGLAERTAFFAE